MDHNYNPAGLIVPTQIPLDGKNYFKTLNEIKNLGVNNQLAFGYYACMPAFCLENKTWYVWDIDNKLGQVGLLDENFVYPQGSFVYGIDYSGESYNFYPFAGYISGATYTKACTGFITQEGTQDPVFEIQSNNIGDIEDFEVVRNSVGDYHISHSLFVTENSSKIFALVPAISNITDTLAFIKSSVSEDGKIRITTVTRENELADNLLFNTPIKIEFFG